MSDEQSFEDQEAERWENAERLMYRITSDYEALVRTIGTAFAHDWLKNFTEDRAPPPPSKGVHKARYDAELLAAHITAPDGDKMLTMQTVAKRHKQSDDERTLRQKIYRLRRDGLTPDQFLHLMQLLPHDVLEAAKLKLKAPSVTNKAPHHLSR